MSKKLKTIREEIDTHDNAIHDVLMRRAELIDDVIAEKKKHDLQFVHPAREAQMIRRLLARHKGDLPEATIVRIWRELVGSVSLLQTGLKISVCMENEDSFGLWELARNYFGSVVPMQKHSSPLVSLASVREGEASFAVLPWPKDEEDLSWWMSLLDREQGLSIVCALPYGVQSGQGKDTPDQALVVSKIDFDASGDDHSFVILDVPHETSRARIMDVLTEQKFKPISIFSKMDDGAERTFHLIELDDYLVSGDARIDAICDGFDDQQDVYCHPVGGYPVPPVYKKK